ncbi:MAG: hypothetical protein M1812_001491 [Candelaria pacifica]|nr:MAG: hypothetical protein M1812_001491 [Candelaria pacifica]
MSQWHYWPYAYPPFPKPAEPAPANTRTTYTYQPRYSQPTPAAAQPNIYPGYYSGPYTYYPYAPMPYPSSPTQNPQPPQPTHVPAPAQPQVYQYQPSYSNPYAAAAMPNSNGNPIWYGATKTEVDHGNMEIANRFGATAPQQMIPANPDPNQQYLCYEPDGTMTLRRKAEIMEDLQPGYWGVAPNGGPYFVRQKPA